MNKNLIAGGIVLIMGIFALVFGSSISFVTLLGIGAIIILNDTEEEEDERIYTDLERTGDGDPDGR